MCKAGAKTRSLGEKKGRKVCKGEEEEGKGQCFGGSGLEDTVWQGQSHNLSSRDKVDVGAAAGGSLRLPQTIGKT